MAAAAAAAAAADVTAGSKLGLLQLLPVGGVGAMEPNDELMRVGGVKGVGLVWSPDLLRTRTDDTGVAEANSAQDLLPLQPVGTDTCGGLESSKVDLLPWRLADPLTDGGASAEPGASNELLLLGRSTEFALAAKHASNWARLIVRTFAGADAAASAWLPVLLGDTISIAPPLPQTLAFGRALH